MIFYTYLWLREDGTPYYVGKGCLNRAWRRSSPPPGRVLVQEHPSERDAFVAEIFFIAYYGRKDLGTGCLMNMTDGGDGTSNPSVEIRARMSAAKKGKPSPHKGRRHTAEARANMSFAHKGKPSSQKGSTRSVESRAKMSVAHKGLPSGGKGREVSLETRAKLSAANKGKPGTMKGKKHSAEALVKIRAASLGNKNCVGRKVSSETLAKQRASHLGQGKGRKVSLETCAKRSASMKGRPSPLKGRKQSAEHVANNRAAQLARLER